MHVGGCSRYRKWVKWVADKQFKEHSASPFSSFLVLSSLYKDCLFGAGSVETAQRGSQSIFHPSSVSCRWSRIAISWDKISVGFDCILSNISFRFFLWSMKGCRVSLNKTKPIHSSSCAIGNSFHYYKKTLLRLKKKKKKRKEKKRKKTFTPWPTCLCLLPVNRFQNYIPFLEPFLLLFSSWIFCP